MLFRLYTPTSNCYIVCKKKFLRKMCKSFRIGLVLALFGAIACNLYLMFMLWSGTVPNDHSSSMSLQIENLNKFSFSGVYGLNITKLKRIVYSEQFKRKQRTSLLPEVIQDIKKNLHQHQIINRIDLAKKISKWISSDSLIPPEAPELGRLMNHLQGASIIKASVPRVGTQLKILIYLQGGHKALLKPQWYERNTTIEGEVYSGADRHNGEIAGFYLSLLLDFRRTPVAVGRRVNLARDILPTADKDLANTFYKNEKGQTCFYGVCRYCKPEMSVCGRDNSGDVIEAAIVLWLPDSIKLKSNRSPWQRTYRKNVPAAWELDDHYCVKLLNQSKTFQVKQDNRRMLDLIDASIFDFLMSNGDRHHYEFITGVSNPAILLLDNGKRSDIDYLDILAPLYQCCILRKSTYDRLITIESGPTSALLEQLTIDDPLYPLLTSDHLLAIDRRVDIVLKTVQLCAKERSWEQVLVPY